MSQYDERDSPRGDDTGDCETVNGVIKPYPYFGMDVCGNNLTEETAIKSSRPFCLADLMEETNVDSSQPFCLPGKGTMNTTKNAQEEEEDESNDYIDELADLLSAPRDDASVFTAPNLSNIWGFGGIPLAVFKLFFGGLHWRETDSTVSANENEGPAIPIEEELPAISFQSKYIHDFPLYQDYCLQSEKDYLPMVAQSCQSELVTPQFVSGLQSPITSRAHFVGASAQPGTIDGLLASPASLRVSSCTLWQELNEVKELGLLSIMTPREIRLQEAMFEMISSEASYLRSIGVAVSHFCASKALRRTVSRMEHHILFSNLRHVMVASEKFLMDLEDRLGESVALSQVGDIVLRHCPTLHSLYVPYVTNMMYQEALVSQLLQENKDFFRAVKKLESDPICQRQSLKSFLVLPFQRITRLKIIMENILKRTEPDTTSVFYLTEAIGAIHKIVTECDEGVQKMKQIEELVHLEKLLDFGNVKSVPLITSGRFLVNMGPLRQLTLDRHCSWGSPVGAQRSFTDVYLHLFNDLLIISLKKEQRFSVLDHAAFPEHVHLEQLKTELLGLPSESFLLRLSQNHSGQPTALILVPYTRSDKEAWMKALS